MFNLATLFVDVVASTARFDQAISSTHRQLSGLDFAAATFVGNIAASLARAAIHLGEDMFGGTVMSAAHLEETVNKVQVVFGGASREILANADEMAKSFSLPKQAMLDAGAQFGMLGKVSGLSKDDAAKFGVEMTKLAADARSFYDVPIEEAMLKIQSGLAGQSRPLREFGVFINEAAVKEEALRMGLGKTGAELTEGQKVMARASLITQQMSDASGDLARTFGSTENQVQAFWGALSNLGTSIGQTLMPAFDQLVAGANATVRGMAEGFEENKAMFAGWVASILEATSTVGVMWRNVGDIWEIVKIQASGMVLNTIAYMGAWMENLQRIADWYDKNFWHLITDGLTAMSYAFMNFGENIFNLGQALRNFFENPTAGFQFQWKPLLDGFKATTEAMPEMIKPALVDVQGQIDEVTDRMAGREIDLAAKNAVKPKSELALLAESATRSSKMGLSGEDDAANKFKAQVLGAADFASKLRLAQGSEDVPQKQLSELEKIREQEKLNGESLARIADMSFGAVLA